MPKSLNELLQQGLQVSQRFGDAKTAFDEWKEAIATAREAGTVKAEDMPSLDQRLEAVHAESMAMSRELDEEIERQRRR